MKLAAFAAMLAVTALAQIQPASDLSLRSEKVQGIEVRYADWHWWPDLFAQMEKGGGTTPEAKRNWMLFRLVNQSALTLEGKVVPASNYGLAVWPNLDGKGMMFELRRVDMRDVYIKGLNVFGPLPEGTTIWKGPANFETVSDTAERCSISLAEDSGKVNVTIRYGNRRAVLTFARVAAPAS
jgi:hypothetical protein